MEDSLGSESGTEIISSDGMLFGYVVVKLEVSSLGESLGSEGETLVGSSGGFSVGNFDGKLEISSLGVVL